MKKIRYTKEGLLLEVRVNKNDKINIKDEPFYVVGISIFNIDYEDDAQHFLISKYIARYNLCVIYIYIYIYIYVICATLVLYI